MWIEKPDCTKCFYNFANLKMINLHRSKQLKCKTYYLIPFKDNFHVKLFLEIINALILFKDYSKDTALDFDNLHEILNKII